MRANKIMFLILSLLLAVALFGCQAPQTLEDTSPSPSPIPAGDSITMLIPSVFITPDELAARADRVNALLRERGIPVNLIMESSPWNQISAINSDILFISTADYRKLAAEGELFDITDALDPHDQLYEINTPLTWQSVNVDGARYGIPLTRSYNDLECASHSGMYIRTDILEELGLTMPETPDELVDAALAAKERGLAYEISYANTVPPYALHRTYENWPFYVDADSLLLCSDQGVVKAYPGSDEYMQDAYTLSSMNELGVLRVYGDGDAQYRALTGKWDVFAAFCPAPPPQDAANYSVLQFNPRRENFNFNYAYAHLLSISSYCAAPDLAMDVLECLYTQREVFDAFVYGEEGKDYTLDESGSITQLKESMFSQGFAQRYMARQNTASVPPRDFHYVAENTMIYTMPARLFVPGNVDLRNALLSAPAYKCILALRVSPVDPMAIDSAVEELMSERLLEYVSECQEEYSTYF